MNNGVQKIWIIDKEAGISIFDQSFEELPEEINSDLIGGFFIAMMSFSQEVAKQQIEFLQLKLMRFYFHEMKQHLLILATSDEITPREVKDIALKIQQRFETKYKNVLSEKFTGDVSIFNSFADDIENILEKPCLCYSNFEAKPELLQYYETSKNRWQKLQSQISSHIHQFDACASNMDLVCQMKSHMSDAIHKMIKKSKCRQEENHK